MKIFHGFKSWIRSLKGTGGFSLDESPSGIWRSVLKQIRPGFIANFLLKSVFSKSEKLVEVQTCGLKGGVILRFSRSDQLMEAKNVWFFTALNENK